MAISCQRRSTVSKNRRDFIEVATILHLELINVWTSEMKFIVKRQYVYVLQSCRFCCHTKNFEFSLRIRFCVGPGAIHLNARQRPLYLSRIPAIVWRRLLPHVFLTTSLVFPEMASIPNLSLLSNKKKP